MSELKALEAYPALHFAAAFVVAMFGVVMLYRGYRDGKRSPAPDPALLFFDGPIDGCLKAIARVAAALEHAPILQAELRAGLVEIGERVSAAKKQLFDEIEKVELREQAARKELEERLRKAENEITRLGVGLSRPASRR